ncbi:hypothetical protein CP979_25105 [Streptomyces filamentosus]|nr:hypothetical protein CP979_25105 [Streptomyces filamentosus]
MRGVLRGFAATSERTGATKNPSCRKASEGSASGGSQPAFRGPASADALSKYENSGAHGTDPLARASQLSSRWDGRLIM